MIATTNQIKALRTESAEAGDMRQIELCDMAEGVGDEAAEYARLTAADMGSDIDAAIRAMADEPGEVASALGVSDDVVRAWIKCAVAIREVQDMTD